MKVLSAFRVTKPLSMDSFLMERIFSNEFEPRIPLALKSA